MDAFFLQVEPSFASDFRSELIERMDAEDKILLPSSILGEIRNLESYERLLFRITNLSTQEYLHVGVLEFIAPPGIVVMPYSMMEFLSIPIHGTVSLQLVRLPKATSITLKANTYEFYELYNPRVVLERKLRNYACVQVGQVIRIHYLDSDYFLTVIDLKPSTAADLINTNLNLDLEPADDTPPPPPPEPVPEPIEEPVEFTKLTPVYAKPSAPPSKVFTGVGRTIGTRF